MKLTKENLKDIKDKYIVKENLIKQLKNEMGALIIKLENNMINSCEFELEMFNENIKELNNSIKSAKLLADNWNELNIGE